MPPFSSRKLPARPDIEVPEEDEFPVENAVPEERGSVTGGTQPPGAAPPKGMWKLERSLIAILVVLMLLIPIAYMLAVDRNRVEPERTPPDNGNESPSVRWPTYMSVDGKRTLAGQTLDIYGDIIVNRSAELDITDCDITMNGTFYVYGKLAICDTRLREPAPSEGFRYHSMDGGNLSLPLDLKGCRAATLRFRTSYVMQPSDMRLDVIDGGARTEGLMLLTGEPQWNRNLSADLTQFCGNEIAVQLVPSKNSFLEFNIFALELATDAGATGYDPDAATFGTGWASDEFRFPFEIILDMGSLLIDGSSLKRLDAGSMLIYGDEARLRIARSTLQLDETGLSGHYGSQAAIGGLNCSLEMEGSSILNGYGVELSNSVLSINDTLFSNLSTAIYVQDSDLGVDRCRFDGCYGGISASTGEFARRGVVRVNGTTIDTTGNGITLANLSAVIEDCSITGGSRPLTVYARSDLSRESCTAENVVDLRNCLLSVEEGDQPARAIWLYSSIPVTGLERLLGRNHFNSSIVLERFLLLNFTYNQTSRDWNDERLYSNSGMQYLYDAQMNPSGERPFSEGGQHMDNFGYDAWAAPDHFSDWNIYTHVVPVDRISLDGTGYVYDRLDETALSFKAITENGIGSRSFDARALLHPQDALEVHIPVQSLCDISILGVHLSLVRTGNESYIDVIYYVSVKGLTVNDFQATCTLGNVNLIRIEEANAYVHEMKIDILRIRGSGELVLRVSPVGVEDDDLSDNEFRANVSLVPESRQFTGPVNLTGIWLLSQNVSIAFRNCTIWSCGTYPAIFGLGGNRIDIDNSSLDALYEQFSVGNGSIRNTDIMANSGSMSADGYSQFTIHGGNWTIDNISCGYRAREFGRIPSVDRAAFLDNLKNGTHYTEAMARWVAATMVVDNLTVANSSFLCQEGTYLCGAVNMTVTHCAFGFGMSGNVEGENTTVSDCDVLDFTSFYFYGSNLTIERNIFSDTMVSITSETNFTFRGNRVEQRAPSALGGISLELYGTGPVQLLDNTFSGMDVAILLKRSGEASDILTGNQFENIQSFIAKGVKRVRVELAPEFFTSLSNNTVRDVSFHWEDLVGSRSEYVYQTNSYIHENVSVYCTNQLEPVVWLMHTNGSISRLSGLPVKISMWFQGGPYPTVDRTIPVRDDYDWTEYIE